MNDMMSAVQAKPGKEKSRKGHLDAWIWKLVILAITAIILIASWLFWQKTISMGADAAISAYEKNKELSQSETYQKYYDDAYEKARKEFGVSNKVSISLGTVREEANLEVLRVSDEEYIIENEAFKEKGIYSWISARGTGVFTVNMQAGEYVVDNDRHYVLVRIPEPEMTKFALDENEMRQLFYADGAFKVTVPVLRTELSIHDGSYQLGTELIDSQKQEAYTTIRDRIVGNQEYYVKAKESTKAQIKKLVQALNISVENLIVEVEFIENS